MTMRKEHSMKKFNRTAVAAVLVLVLTAGCSGMMQSGGHMAMGDHSAMQSMGAADLRTGLNALLSEHVDLAAAATGHALGGREAPFKAAAGALDANSVDLSKAIGSVYGADAEAAF